VLVGAGSLWPLPKLTSAEGEMLNTSHFNQCFFGGAKFRPEKYDFNLLKGFSMEKMAQIRNIFKKK
jgi:hypothetical protein